MISRNTFFFILGYVSLAVISASILGLLIAAVIVLSIAMLKLFKRIKLSWRKTAILMTAPLWGFVLSILAFALGPGF